MANPEVAAATAAVKQRLEEGAGEYELVELIRTLHAKNGPKVLAFDPHDVRLVVMSLVGENPPNRRGAVLARVLTTALPDDPFNWRTRVYAGLRLRDFGDVIVAASRAIDKGISVPHMLRDRANALLERSEPAAALSDCERALSLPHIDDDLLKVLQGLRTEAQRATAAIAVLTEMHDELDGGKRSCRDLVRRWAPFPMTAQDFVDGPTGKPRLLARDFNWTVRVTYSVAEVAYSYFERGEKRFPREAFAALAIVCPLDAYMKLMVAASEVRLGKLEEAIEAYGEALSLAPTAIAALANRGELYMDRGDLDLALRDLSAAVALDQRGEDEHANRSRCVAWAIGDVFPEFRARAEVARGPLRLSAECETGRREIVAKLRGFLDRARAAGDVIEQQLVNGGTELDVASQIRERLVPYLRERLLVRVVELGDRDDTRALALSLVHALSAAMPDDPKVWSPRASLSLQASDFADAVAAATRAIELGDDGPVMYFTRSYAYLNRFDPESAMPDLEHLAQMSALTPELKHRVEGWIDDARRAIGGRRVVRDNIDALASGALSAEGLLRKWSSRELTDAELQQLESSGRNLARELGWSAKVTTAIGALAESYLRRGSRAAAGRVARALVLFDPAVTDFRALEAACTTMVETAPRNTPATAGSESPTEADPRGERPPVRILFLAADPSDQARLAVTREVEQLGERLRATEHRDRYEIVQHWQVTAEKLQGLILRYRPQIVHFSGHGTEDGELVFQAEDGTSSPLPVEVVANVFSILQRYVRCVVLNACYSKAQATAIATSVDVVVGMANAIPDADAISFAGAFYEALGYGEDVKTAFDLANNAIQIAQGVRGAGPKRDLGGGEATSADAQAQIPNLLVRSGVDASTVRFVTARS